MAIDIDALLTEIHKKHGLTFTRDDPVMAFVTVNEIMVHEFLHEHKKAMAESVSEIEAFMTRGNENARNTSKQMLQEAAKQSECIINQALSGSKEALQKAVEEAVKTKTADIRAQLERSIERTRLAANIALIAACAAIFTAGIALLSAW